MYFEKVFEILPKSADRNTLIQFVKLNSFRECLYQLIQTVLAVI